MNQGGPHQQDMYYQSQMSAGQQQPPHTVTSYNPHQQPPLLQPSHGSYPPPPQPYAPNNYYSNGALTSPQQQGPPQMHGMGQNVLPLPVGSQPGMAPAYQQGGFDTTGQVAPQGMKPRVTATLWEDEGSLCFQVEARGICVARREDNHMINGTKLLNVAGMTRGRRDGILKSEKVRNVVKIGPMHLKGVWIPFDRALDFANKEKITELLYPLFVHNIGALLYHPTNQNRTSQVLAAQERRKAEQQQQRLANGQPPPLPSLHHHSMSLGSQHQGMPRPPLDRAHTYSTPPTPASGVMNGGLGAQDNYHQWSQPGMNGSQPHNPMSIDTSLSNAGRSMPATPASTPPGTSLQSMHPSYPPVSQPYDSSRSIYNAAPSHQAAPAHHSPYQTHNGNTQDNRGMYAPTSYIKNEMGPPSSRPLVGAVQGDTKPSNGDGYQSQGQGEQPSNGQNEEEAEHEHDGEYTHDSNGYDATRSSYYNSAPSVSAMPSEHQHPEIGSPNQSASGRATPRTAPAPQTYYSQQGYGTPPQPQPPLRTLDYSSNDTRSQTNGTTGTDPYATQPEINGSLQNGYTSQQSAVNGSGGVKRGRDDDDERSASTDLKRRKTLVDGQLPDTTYETSMNRPIAAISRGRR